MREKVLFWTANLLCIAGCAGGREREPPKPSPLTLQDDVPEQPQTHRQAPEPLHEQDSRKPDDSPQVPQPTPEKPKRDGLKAICGKINQRATQKCSKQVTELYRSSCSHYLHKPGSCEAEIQTALECQYEAADDAFCAHQAGANCSPANRALKACQHGTAPVEQNTAEDLTLPENWEQVRDSQLGFAVAMPPGAELDAQSKRRTWRAEEAGVTYYVAEIDYPTAKLNNATYVRTVVGYVGYRCQQHLKLHGELELKGFKVVQFHSRCQNGTEWHGMLHFWNGKAVSTALQAPAGSTGVQEPFFYSFAPSE